jgi:hypothetical protein
MCCAFLSRQLCSQHDVTSVEMSAASSADGMLWTVQSMVERTQQPTGWNKFTNRSACPTTRQLYLESPFQVLTMEVWLRDKKANVGLSIRRLSWDKLLESVCRRQTCSSPLGIIIWWIASGRFNVRVVIVYCALSSCYSPSVVLQM